MASCHRKKTGVALIKSEHLLHSHPTQTCCIMLQRTEVTHEIEWLSYVVIAFATKESAAVTNWAPTGASSADAPPAFF